MMTAVSTQPLTDRIHRVFGNSDRVSAGPWQTLGAAAETGLYRPRSSGSISGLLQTRPRQHVSRQSACQDPIRRQGIIYNSARSGQACGSGSHPGRPGDRPAREESDENRPKQAFRRAATDRALAPLRFPPVHPGRPQILPLSVQFRRRQYRSRGRHFIHSGFRGRSGSSPHCRQGPELAGDCPGIAVAATARAVAYRTLWLTPGSDQG